MLADIDDNQAVHGFAFGLNYLAQSQFRSKDFEQTF